MKELKTKGSLTVAAAICIFASIIGGILFFPAARGMNGVWHTLFPQYVESKETRLFLSAPLSVNTGPAHITEFPAVRSKEYLQYHYYSAPAHRVADR